LLALSAAAAAALVVLTTMTEPSELPTKSAVVLLIVAFATVGALVASHRPDNSIGWIFCVGAPFWVLGELALQYAVYAEFDAPGAPGEAWMTWVGGWARGMGWFLIVPLLLLLFPNGKLPSARWRPALWAAAGFLALFTVAALLSPVSVDTRLESVRHPLGLDLEVAESVAVVSFVLAPVLLALSGAAVIARFRRSSGDERQQLKWFVYAVGIAVVLFAAGMTLALVGAAAPSPALWILPLLGLPVATGIAILKHRLYDIDVIVNRTLVYGALSAILAGTYALVVTVVSSFARGSELTVAAATLAVAGAFQPLRRRVQAFIDRRFYRRKYDAARTLEAFATRLRDEVDIDRLTGHLVAVVGETVHPSHISLWLRY
jgi:hypothetical protein